MITYTGLIPVYKNDRLDYLEAAVGSLIKQTKPLDEIILVVEGDVSNEIEGYLSGLILPISVLRINDQKGPLNFGLPASLNFGINNSKCDFILRLDSDDFSVPHRLETIDRLLLENPELDLIGSWVDEYDEELKEYISTRKVPTNGSKIFSFGRWKNPFNGPSVVFRKTVAFELGGYPVVASNEDYCFWAEFLVRGFNVRNIPESLVNMRTGLSMIPRRKSRRYRMGTIQSIAYIYSIGYFGFVHYCWHNLVNTLVRRLPEYVFFIIQFKVFRK